MDAGRIRTLAWVAAALVAGGAAGFFKDDPRLTVAPAVADTVPVSAEQRAAGFGFGPDVSASDRAWIEAALASARPEALTLISEIDGTVVLGATPGPMMGVTRLGLEPTRVELNFTELNGRRIIDRGNVLLHELGHVVDYKLVDQPLNDRVDAGIPRSGACGEHFGVRTGVCAEPEERFADTFAKWALRGRVSGLGAGYGIPTPSSLEDWGAPLAVLAREVSLRR